MDLQKLPEEEREVPEKREKIFTDAVGDDQHGHALCRGVTNRPVSSRKSGTSSLRNDKFEAEVAELRAQYLRDNEANEAEIAKLEESNALILQALRASGFPSPITPGGAPSPRFSSAHGSNSRVLVHDLELDPEASKDEDEDHAPSGLMSQVGRMGWRIRSLTNLEAKRQKQMLGSLPKLFDMVLYQFQQADRGALKKGEVLDKIISDGRGAVVNRGELVEQITLLLKLAPDWFYEKTSNGHLYLYIQLVGDLGKIRDRLVAKAQSA